jgi:histidinol dehydrogenase
MTVIPAKVAGVEEIILATPPGKNGRVSPVTLAAAAIAGVDRVFCMGGAHALAAMAFGTETVPAVDKLCGPGNIYVTLAKKLLYGVVGIDGLFGPSEVLIIADDAADPAHCASDLMAQAEHTLGSAVFVTTSTALAEKVAAELEKQVAVMKNPAALKQSLDERGVIAVVESMEEAVELANLYAPEHLCLMTEDAAAWTGRIRNAGCIIAGRRRPWCSATTSPGRAMSCRPAERRGSPHPSM